MYSIEDKVLAKKIDRALKNLTVLVDSVGDCDIRHKLDRRVVECYNILVGRPLSECKDDPYLMAERHDDAMRKLRDREADLSNLESVLDDLTVAWKLVKGRNCEFVKEP